MRVNAKVVSWKARFMLTIAPDHAALIPEE